MNFALPNLLWLLALVPALICFFLAAWKRRQRLIAEFIPRRLVAELTVGVSHRRQKARMVLVTVAVVLVILALARPRWGFKWDEATQKGLDIIVAIDASRSMLATDVAPNRLERAKLAALDLMALAKTDRIGLIAFAGSAFLQCPLTLDDNAFRQSVEALKPEIMPQGGTALAETIAVAMDAFENEEENYKVLILFTDGEDHQEMVMERAEEADETGLRIFTVGVGRPEGDLIPVGRQNGRTVFLKDKDGQVVKSRLNEALLQQLAGAAKGFYLNLSGAAAIETLYTQGLGPLPKAEVTSRLVRRYFERFYWPLVMAIVLLLIEMYLPEKRRSRRPKPAVPAAVVVAALLALFGGAGSAKANPAAAMKAFEAGDYDKALDLYEQLQRKNPKDHRLLYNAGAAAYRAGDFDSALQNFSGAIAAEDPNIQRRVWQNLGHTQYRLGQGNENPEKRLESWKTAVKMYDQVLKMDPEEATAVHNRDHVQKMVKALEEQLEKEKGEDGEEGEDGDDKDQEKKDSDKQDKDKKSDQQDQQGKDSEQEKQDGQDGQEGEDKKDQQQKPGEQDPEKKDESAADQKKGGEKKPQPKPEEGKEGEEKPQPKPGEGGEGADSEKQQQMVMQKTLTMEQALRLLDAQRSTERALIFRPQDRRQDDKDPKRPILKTW